MWLRLIHGRVRLAHCKQMNHSKAFWAVRNQYADHMRMLWSRGYTGEGLWGRGAFLGTGAWETNAIRPDEHLPEHLCGGTYRSRGRKRRAKAQPTYQEQKARRILKRFGANGVALGEDARVKRGLEKGRAIGAKPRVAGSKRGRELRAAAALARFGQQKEEEEEEDEEEDKKPKEEDAETESGSEFEDDAADKGTSDAVDINGTKLLDGKGRGMIKVCGDETSEDQDVRNELSELRSSMHHGSGTTSWPQAIKLEPGSGSTRHEQKSKRVDDPKKPELLRNLPPPRRDEDKKQSTTTSTAKEETDVPKDHQAAEAQSSGQKVCPVCSCDNEALSVTCAVCNNVLDPKHVPGTWSCRRTACEGSKYLNAGDCGVCGACGERRAASAR